MIERESFIRQWRGTFGCEHGGICWCDTVIKLGFLYDWFMESIGESISSHADKEEVEPNTIGWENLPVFMDERKKK